MIVFENPEGATPLDPEEINGLKLKHITTRAELDRWEQDNIQDALAWIEKRRRSNIVTEQFICQLHEQMFGKVWRWAGKFRRTNKNIGVPWTHITIQLTQLLDDVNYWITNQTFSNDEIAFRFHHRLVWIHLFPNGNGRHSRMMADLLLSEIFECEAFSWGSNSLSADGIIRRQYIDALRAADNHEYKLLAEFVRT